MNLFPAGGILWAGPRQPAGTDTQRKIDMPIFEYECTRCGKTYDVLHKGKELEEDIECPHCGSKEYVKLMSVPAAPKIAGGGFNDAPSPCDSCCANGSCGMN
jgi:putative FmdB family regulatory protein